MVQQVKKIGLLNLVALLGAAVAVLLVGRFMDSTAALLASILSALGLLVALCSYFQM